MADAQLFADHARMETLAIYQHVALEGEFEPMYQEAIKKADPVALSGPLAHLQKTRTFQNINDFQFGENVGMSKHSNRNKQRRHLRKSQLAERLGGQCKECGYNKSPSALEFHHRDERTKSFNISGTNLSKRSWNNLVAEADKCDLLCANCHREHHDEFGWIHEDGKRTPRMKLPS